MWTECGYRTGYDGRYQHECWQEWDYECYFVEFEDETGHTYTDCADEQVWEDLAVGDTYTSWPQGRSPALSGAGAFGV